MSELHRIDELIRLFPGKGALVGNGDDAAVLQDGLTISVDSVVENVHFRRDFADWDALAARGFEAAASDLAAMGATPMNSVVALTLPSNFGADAFSLVAQGIARAATRTGAHVVGGNLTTGAEFSMTTTVFGRTTEPLRRSGARVGDAIYISGNPWPIAIGLRDLLAGKSNTDAARAWLSVKARIDLGQALRGRATAAIDVSDGLALDLSRLCKASQVGAELDLTELIAANQGQVTEQELLTAAESYELIFTLPATAEIQLRVTQTRIQPPLVIPTNAGFQPPLVIPANAGIQQVEGGYRIGTVIADAGLRLHGQLVDAHGHDHFASPDQNQR